MNSKNLVSREACRLVRAQPADKPLFLYVPFNGVHSPLQVPEEYKKAYPNLTGAKSPIYSQVNEAQGRFNPASRLSVLKFFWS